MEADTDSRRLKIDRDAFSAAFSDRPLRVRHSLLDHPLLTVGALGELAEALPEDRVEHNVGSLPEVVGDSDVERSKLSPGEIARSIETNGLWMVLKDIELRPEYRQMLDELLDEVEPIVGAREGGMILRKGFIFLSAPGSVTPSHTDSEHNLLLQVRGSKEITVGCFPDERTRQLELENHFSGGHRNIDWMPVDPDLFRLQPGDAVYVPPHAPHWVKNGEQASVSLSITFRTPATERAARVSSINARLRKLRLQPRPPGENQSIDRAKAAASKALGRIRRLG